MIKRWWVLSWLGGVIAVVGYKCIQIDGNLIPCLFVSIPMCALVR